MRLLWRELFTRAVLGRSRASKQLAPQRYRRLGALFFQRRGLWSDRL